MICLRKARGWDFDRENDTKHSVNKYYDLATSFYEFGWREPFHFAPRWKWESLRESIKRHKHFLALQVLDVGCGIGGPLREIARFRFLLYGRFLFLFPFLSEKPSFFPCDSASSANSGCKCQVAKEASDMVLADDNFNTIVAAVADPK